MSRYISRRYIYEKLVCEFNTTFCGYPYSEIQNYLWIEDDYAPKYGINGIYKTIWFLKNVDNRIRFNEEFIPICKLTSVTRSYLHDYCAFFDNKLYDVSIPEEFYLYGNDFNVKIINLFKNDIEQIIKEDREYLEEHKNDIHVFDPDKNWIDGIFVEALKNVYKDIANEEISTTEILKMMNNDKSPSN